MPGPRPPYIYICICMCVFVVSGGSDGKESACNVGDLDSIPGSGRSPGAGIGNPLQYSCLENPKDGETWPATVLGVSELGVTERLTHTHTNSIYVYR